MIILDNGQVWDLWDFGQSIFTQQVYGNSEELNWKQLGGSTRSKQRPPFHLDKVLPKPQTGN